MPPQRRQPKRDLNDLTGLRVALYCRVSQDKDSDDRAAREKSVDDQEAEGRQWIERHGATIVRCICGCGADSYRDSDRSASRYATKKREHYIKLCADIEAGRIGAVWFWEQSRSTRRLEGFAELRNLCRRHHVLWIINGRVQDPDSYQDMTLAGIQAIIAEQESEQTSERVARGMKSLAVKGKPHGRIAYGYRRVYDERTREFVRQEPDVWDGDGQAVEDSPAWVVAEVFRRIAAGDSYNAIVRDLNVRGVPTPGALTARRNGGRRQGRPGRYPDRAPRWTWSGLKVIAGNPAYIRRRIFQGEILDDVEAVWPGLVDDDVFWAVQKKLGVKTRKRWGAAKYLLTTIAMCDVCGGWLTRSLRPPPRGYDYPPMPTYYCQFDFCTGIKQQVLDDYVERVVVGWLSDPEVYAELSRVDDSAIAAEARAEANRLRVDLEDWRKKALAGEVTASFYANIEADRLARIEEQEKRTKSSIPSVLAGNMGPQAGERWKELDVAVKRQIISAIAEIRLKPAGKGIKVPVHERVVWRPRLGPATALPVGPADSPLRAMKLTQVDADVLIAVAGYGPFPAKELVSRLGLAYPRNYVSKLVRRGLLQQQGINGGSYRRGQPVLITLTEAGRDAAAILLADVED